MMRVEIEQGKDLYLIVVWGISTERVNVPKRSNNKTVWFNKDRETLGLRELLFVIETKIIVRDV